MLDALAIQEALGQCFSMTAFPEPKHIDVGDISLSVHETGAGENRQPVILVHGWPEIAYSWRRQFAALADAGYHVIAPNLRGFGASDAPKDKSLYTIHHMASDLTGLLDALDLEKAVFCGHDWGGLIVWPFATMKPERVDGVIGVCTPHRRLPKQPPLAGIEKRYTKNHYFIRFQEDGAPEKLFTGHEEKFFKMMFRKPAPRAIWDKLIPRIYDIFTAFEKFSDQGADDVVIAEDDLQVYVNAYKTSGFHGGVNLYRNVDVNYELLQGVDPMIHKPCLWIGADLDIFLPPEWSDQMEDLIPDLEKHLIKNSGHWVMQEKPEELNALLLDWLNRRFPANRA